MTVIQKLSDRENLIFEAITLILVNAGNMDVKKLQWKLFECGIYAKKPLLVQALTVMKEKGLISKPNESKDEKTNPETTEAPRKAIVQYPS